MSSRAALKPEESVSHILTGSMAVKPLLGSPRRKVQSISSNEFASSASVATLGWNLWPHISAKHHLASRCERNVLIVGAGTLGREVAAILKDAGLNVVGFLDETAAVAGDVLGRVDDLGRIARVAFADEVLLAIPDQHDATQRAVREARRNSLNIGLVPDFHDLGTNGELGCERAVLALEYFGNLPVLTLRAGKRVALALFLKRGFDLFFAASAILAMAPLMAGIALAIRFTSPGKVLYRATRVGRKGRRFICYKFRTMVANADKMKDSLRSCNERQGPCFKMMDDPRITPLGRFLRRYSLDELPQLWNVLQGEMSVVGPRPHPLDDFERYQPDHLRRLEVVPGITGLWQVTARSDPSFQRNMALDIQYIEHWSFWMDLEILRKTVFVILRGSGA